MYSFVLVNRTDDGRRRSAFENTTLSQLSQLEPVVFKLLSAWIDVVTEVGQRWCDEEESNELQLDRTRDVAS